MGHKTEAQRKLNNALSIVWNEAKQEVAYHQACMVKAQTAVDYCFVRMMQIDPD